MIRLLLLVLLFVLALVAGSYFISDKGYVLFSYGGTSVEMTFFSLTISIVLVLLVVWIVKRLVSGSWHLASGTANWFRTRAAKKANKALFRGFEAYLMHDWQQAEQYLAQAKISKEWQPLRDLFAASAANKAGDTQKAQTYLANLPQDSKSNLLFRASLQNQLKQFDKAQEHVESYLSSNKKDASAIKVQIDSLLGQGKYQEAITLFTKAEKAGSYTEQELQTIKGESYQAVFDDLLSQGQIDQAKSMWKKLSKSERQLPTVQFAWLNALAQHRQDEVADEALQQILKASGINVLNKLCSRLGFIKAPNTMTMVQKRLEKTPDDKSLIKAYGLLAYLNQDFELTQKALLPQQDELSRDELAVLAKAMAKNQDYSSAVTVYQQLT